MQAKLEPIYETHKGWLKALKVLKHGLSSSASYKVCETYEELLGVQVSLLSTSPKEKTLFL